MLLIDLGKYVMSAMVSSAETDIAARINYAFTSTLLFLAAIIVGAFTYVTP